MDEVKEKLEEAMDRCLRKAETTVDAGEFEKYIEGSVKIAEALNDIKKSEDQIQMEEKKFKASKNWKDPIIWIPLGATFFTMVIGKLIDRNTLYRQTVAVCNFEETNTFTTQAGKGLGSSLRMFPILNKGDH